MKIKSLYFNVLRLVLLYPLLLSLVACTAIEQPVSQADLDPRPDFPNLFSERPQIASLNDIHQLSPEQELEFLNYFNDPAHQEIDQHQRLANFLSDNNFRYEYQTYSASDALSLNQGNCMTLAVITTSLASLVDVPVNYLLIESAPIYRLNLEGSVANRGVHIRSLVYKPQDDENEVTNQNALAIDFFPSNGKDQVGNVSTNEYVAIYYRNIAAEALIDEDYSKAYWYTLESMKFDPVSPDALNMMAVTYKRIGELAKAEEIYLYGIANAEDKLTLLKNYHLLLSSQGRTEEADQINRRLLTMDDPSPIHWFNVAVNSYDSNDFDNAIRYYNRAIDIAPYLHEAHLGIALSYYQLGRLGRAERAFNQAITNVEDASTRNLYEAKLHALRNVM